MCRPWSPCGRLIALKVRLQKILADAGVASRRASEQLILEGRVAVNGQITRELGSKADPATTTVAVDGRPLRPRRRLYVALHKPAGYLCTRRDEQQRRTVGDLLPVEWSSLYPVGRLDLDSEGLLFLTNDGEFCLRLTHPRFRLEKHYVATVEGKLEPALVKRLTKGVSDRGELLRAKAARLVSANSSHSIVELDLAEGRNREVRRMLEALGFKVVRLVRTAIGPIKLGELRAGRWRVLTEVEVATLFRLTVAPVDKAG